MMLRIATLCFCASLILAATDNCNLDNEEQDEESINCVQDLPTVSSLESWTEHVQTQHSTQGENLAKTGHTSDENVRCSLSPPYTCSWGDCNTASPGVGNVTLADLSVMGGRWQDGLLEGYGNVTYQDKSVLKGNFHHGCLNGLVTLQEEDGTLLVGWYHQGELASGPVWLLYPSREGAMYTYLEERLGVNRLSRAAFTGDTVAWIYPDFKTGIVGQFVAGTMLSAREAEIMENGEENGIPKINMFLIDANTKIYAFDPSTDMHLSSSPLQRDPYERKLLHVQTSRIPGAGVGVFTNLPVKRNTIIGYFNGIHRHRGEIFKDADKSAYLVEGTHRNEMLDIPEEYQSWQKYQGSAGHLINHGQEGNVDYTECWHPRFGRILCVQTLTDLAPETELLVKYDVAVDGDGLKMALKTALHLGHAVSGKSKDQFAKDVRPYLKLVSDIVKTVKMGDLIRF
eukprot:TRINITY_DN7535_c0_g1_i5.p1 TRINITY_DN7535_c0_g1~~TRINITY_DN7535_c0_g1_i5.p1  ORF type:complete len:456 (-),score=87.55 TRINITY_DN7535_c0_g1_i5:164-1531(-)